VVRLMTDRTRRGGGCRTLAMAGQGEKVRRGEISLPKKGGRSKKIKKRSNNSSSTPGANRRKKNAALLGRCEGWKKKKKKKTRANAIGPRREKECPRKGKYFLSMDKKNSAARDNELR